MEILGGFCGFTLKDDFITPVLGWAVSKYQEVVKEVYDDDFYWKLNLINFFYIKKYF